MTTGHRKMFRLSDWLVAVLLLATFAQQVLTEECDGVSFGRTLQDPEDCHGYFLCHGGQKLQQYCAPGMKYDRELGECIVGKCPPCNCIVDPGSGSSTVTPTDTSGTPPEPSASTSPTDTATPTNTPPDTETDTPTGTPPEPSTSTNPTDTATPTNTPPETETDTPTGTPSEPSTSTNPTDTATPTNTPPDTETDTPTGTPPEPSTSTSPTDTATPTNTPPDTETDTTTDTTTPDPAGCTSTPVTGTSTVHPLVNCDNIPNGSFFAHAEHCRNYWVCREGIPVLLYCQIGSWYDEVNDVCNFRHLVDCPANID